LKAVRLEERLIQEVVEFLKLNGHYRDGMSVASCVRTALSLLIYQTPNLADGRDQALEVLSKTSGAPLSTVRGRVAKFAQTYNWAGQQDIHVPEKVRDAIQEASYQTAGDLEVEVRECQIEEVSGSPPTEVFPDKPPWTLMKSVSYDEIIRTHPLHPLVKWASDSPMRIRAMECAFGNVPKSLHKDQKILDMADRLLDYFERWETKKCSR